MHHTIDLLIKQDGKVLEYYQTALEKWAEILESEDANSVDSLAQRLTSEQMWFEHNCGTRWVGQEIMVVSGIGQFYDLSTGFGEDEEKALLVFKAFMASYCSMEVKGVAKDVAKSYYLVDETNFDY